MRRNTICHIRCSLPRVILLLLIMMAFPLLQSCSNEDDPKKDEGAGNSRIDELKDYQPMESEYTVMFYGAGGGNLDEYMISHFADALSALSDEKVQTVFEMKLSYYYQMTDRYPKISGCNRFVVSRKGINTGYLMKRIGDRTYDMSKAESLEDFIRWAKQVCPSRHYILIVWGHGNGWTPTLDCETRAILSDDNNGRALSLGSLVKGVKDSGTRLTALFMDSCAMGMVENYASYEEITDFVISSPMITSSNSGNLYELISAIRNCPGDDQLMASIHSYLEKAMNIYGNIDYKTDLGITDLRYIGELNDIIKDLAQELTSTYQSDEYSIGEAISKTTRYIKDIDLYPCDLLGLVRNLATYSDNPAFDAIQERMERFKAQHFMEASSSTLKSMGFEPFLAISLMDSYTYKSEGFEGTYDKLRFDELTSWSSFLKLNQRSTGSNDNFYDATLH